MPEPKTLRQIIETIELSPNAKPFKEKAPGAEKKKGFKPWKIIAGAAAVSLIAVCAAMVLKPDHARQQQQAQKTSSSTASSWQDNFSRLANAGAASLSEKKYDNAIENYTKAIESLPKGATIAPDLNIARENLAICYEKKGNLEKAIEENTNIIANNQITQWYHPHTFLFNALERRARLYEAKNDFENAIDDCNEILDIEIENQNAKVLLREIKQKQSAEHIAQGKKLYEQKNFEKTIEQYTKAIELNSKDFYPASRDRRNAIIFYERGICYEQTGKFNEAIKDFETTLSLDTDYAPAMLEAGKCYQKTINFEMAVLKFTGAMVFYGETAELLENRAYAYCSKGDFEIALKDFNKAVLLSPNNIKLKKEFDVAKTEAGRIHSVKGNEYDSAGNLEKAIEEYVKAFEINPHYTTETILNLAKIKKEAQDVINAEESRKKIALEKYNLFYNSGIDYFNRGDFENSIDRFTKAIEANPAKSSAYSGRGAAYERKADFEKAVNDYSKAAELNPDDLKAKNNLDSAKQKKSNQERLRQKAIDDEIKRQKDEQDKKEQARKQEQDRLMQEQEKENARIAKENEAREAEERRRKEYEARQNSQKNESAPSSPIKIEGHVGGAFNYSTSHKIAQNTGGQGDFILHIDDISINYQGRRVRAKTTSKKNYDTGESWESSHIKCEINMVGIGKRIYESKNQGTEAVNNYATRLTRVMTGYGPAIGSEQYIASRTQNPYYTRVMSQIALYFGKSVSEGYYEKKFKQSQYVTKTTYHEEGKRKSNIFSIQAQIFAGKIREDPGTTERTGPYYEFFGAAGLDFVPKSESYTGAGYDKNKFYPFIAMGFNFGF